MSGGVDSSVSAWLLKQKGYQVEGLFMKNWEEDDNDKYCSSKNDLKDVILVCNKLSIALHTINFSHEYWNNVFKIFLSEHKAGRTPNPDILCNKKIKFKYFLDFAIEELQADYIATGHYVRTKKINKKIFLLRGVYNKTDQSYFLHTLSFSKLERCLFPLGKLKKSDVRKIATKLSLVTANKKSSVGICFIGKKKNKEFLSKYLFSEPGIIITNNKKEIGKHKGLIYYTLGQRKGLEIGGMKGYSSQPWYVIEKKIIDNVLVVAQGALHPCLMSIGVIAKKLYWINRKLLIKSFYCTAKTRYQQADIYCKIILIKKGILQVNFNEPVSGVTPGQSIVFYSNQLCLGGGTIYKLQPLLKKIKYE